MFLINSTQKYSNRPRLNSHKDLYLLVANKLNQTVFKEIIWKSKNKAESYEKFEIHKKNVMTAVKILGPKAKSY